MHKQQRRKHCWSTAKLIAAALLVMMGAARLIAVLTRADTLNEEPPDGYLVQGQSYGAWVLCVLSTWILVAAILAMAHMFTPWALGILRDRHRAYFLRIAR